MRGTVLYGCDATRQAIARDFGATDIVTERGDEGVERIKQLAQGVGADSVLECVATQESMMQAIKATRPGGHIGYVGVPHGVSLDGQQLFVSHVHLHGGPAPVRRYLPQPRLIGRPANSAAASPAIDCAWARTKAKAGYDMVLSNPLPGLTRPMSTVDGGSERVIGTLVSANYFDVLGTQAAIGRFFRPEEDAVPGKHPAIVLSHAFWMRRFGGDPGVLDRPLRLINHRFTVVGVAEPGFQGSSMIGTEVWTPIAMIAVARAGQRRHPQRSAAGLARRGRAAQAGCDGAPKGLSRSTQ
jgi:hypothetical protein